MTETIIDTTSLVFEADMQLAELCCAKLVGFLQGAVSVGLPALMKGVPDPSRFFPDQFQKMDAYSVVLGTISGKPNTTELLLRLRQCSCNVRQAIGRLQQEINDLLSIQTCDRVANLKNVRDAALAICVAIGEYAGLLRIELSKLTQLKMQIVQIVDAMPALLLNRCGD